MSELTECNYCRLQHMKALAATKGVEVVVRQERMDGRTKDLKGNTLEYSDVWTSARYSWEEKPSAWFRVLTAHCVC